MTGPKLTPSPELVQQLCDNPQLTWLERLSLAYAAGADQELEACCEWLKAKQWTDPEFAAELRTARRPKPPSLKEQALEALEQVDGYAIEQMNAYVIYDELKIHADTIRRALEALPE
jgi:hypothetical protein